MNIFPRDVIDCDPFIFDKAEEMGIQWRIEGNNIAFDRECDIMPMVVVSSYAKYYTINIYDNDYNRYLLHKNEVLNAIIIRLRLILSIPS